MSELTRNSALDSQRHSQDNHEGLISHGIHHATRNGLQLPLPRHPAVNQVCDTRVGEERESPFEVIMHQKVGCHWCRNEAGDGEKVGQIVDSLPRVDVGQGRADFLADGADAPRYWLIARCGRCCNLVRRLLLLLRRGCQLCSVGVRIILHPCPE